MALLATALGDSSILLQAIFTGGLLVTAVGAAWLTWVQLRSTRETNAEQRAAQLQSQERLRVYQLADRTTYLEFIQLMTSALELFRLGDATWQSWWRDRPRDADRETVKQQAVTLLNFCEEIASEYLDELLDREIADKNVAYLAASVWSEAWEFVYFLRGVTHEDRAWERLEDFAGQWLVEHATTTAGP